MQLLQKDVLVRCATHASNSRKFTHGAGIGQGRALSFWSGAEGFCVGVARRRQRCVGVLCPRKVKFETEPLYAVFMEFNCWSCFKLTIARVICKMCTALDVTLILLETCFRIVN